MAVVSELHDEEDNQYQEDQKQKGINQKEKDGPFDDALHKLLNDDRPLVFLDRVLHFLRRKISDDGGLESNSGNGADLEKYSWTQTLSAVSVTIPVPCGTKSRFVVCEIKNNYLKAGLKGQPTILDGELFAPVNADDCFWIINNGKSLSILLMKQNKMEWWKCVVKGEPEIRMAIISEYHKEEDNQEQVNKKQKEVLPKEEEQVKYELFDDTLQKLLQCQHPLYFLDHVLNFLRRKTDLFRDDGTTDMVFSAKQKNDDAQHYKKEKKAVKQKEDPSPSTSRSADVKTSDEAPENPKPKTSTSEDGRLG